MSDQTNLVSQLSANQAYLNELMKQYENITQYLTYAIELKNTHEHLYKFLKQEDTRTVGLSEKMRQDVRKVRQRYIDTLNTARRYEWYSKLYKTCNAFIILMAVCVMLFVDDVMPRWAFIILISVVCLLYLWVILSNIWAWQYRQQDDFTKVDWNRVNSNPTAGK